MKQVCVAVVGAGYAAMLHGNGYKKVSGVSVRLKTIVDIDAGKAEEIRAQFGFEQVCTDFDEMLRDPEIDVVDIVTPPFLHVAMIEKAMAAGKHVICEKPLTGYHGRPGDKAPIGLNVPKSRMYQTVLEELDKLKATVAASGKRFFYAENYVYATPVVKAAEILTKKKSKILFMKGEVSLQGSSSPVAGDWAKTGGGTFIRCGVHPLIGILYLKRVEARARGENITIQSVLADTGTATFCLTEHEHRHISARPVDVEDFSNVTVTFSDGTKAVIMAADVVLGGTKNYIEVYSNDSALMCNMSYNNIMNSYFLDEDGLDDVYISERLPIKLGWNNVAISDEIIRGYTGELQDFMECMAHDREPVCDFELAYDSTRLLYAAYLSAEEGRRVEL